MKTNEFQFQCDFCLDVIYCGRIEKKEKGYGLFGIQQMFVVSDTMKRTENQICPKCLKNEFGLVWRDSEMEDISEVEK